MLEYVRRFVFSFLFFFIDYVVRSKRDNVLISVQYSILDADIKPLVDRIPETIDGQVYLCISDCDSYTTSEEDLHERVSIIEPDNPKFLLQLASCQLVLLQGPHHLHGYRLVWRNHLRTSVLFYHGIITKSYQRYTENSPSQKFTLSSLKYSLRRFYLYTGIDAQSVASDVERFFRSSAEGRHPSHFECIGYPRYDRVTDLVNGGSSSKIVDLDPFETDQSVILYAPTHKDGAYESTPFPFEDFSLKQLRSFLKEHDTRLCLRMHPSEENSGIYDRFVDNKTIFYAGQKKSASSIELLPHVDVLITDYSSIYMDFLPFDRPIVFVKDQHNQFKSQRGLAFDYDRYFPGKTVESTNEFLEHIETCLAGEETYENERAFVRKVLLPHWNESTVNKLVEYAK